MTTPDDQALVRRVAERMGISVRSSGIGKSFTGGPLGRGWRRFNPLAPTREGWADFGAVWEWAKANNLWPHLIGSTPLGYGSVGNGLGSVNSHIQYDEDERRALLLAIDRAGGGA